MKSKYPQFKLSLALLEKEPLKLSGKLPPEFLELEPDGMIESISDIDYKLEAQMISGKVLVKGGFELSLGGSCGRCLEAVTIDLPIDFELFYDEISENDEELDITDDLRAEIAAGKERSDRIADHRYECNGEKYFKASDQCRPDRKTTGGYLRCHHTAGGL